VRADPIVVTSGQFATAVNEPTFYQFFGADGSVLGGIFPLLATSPALICPTVSGCAPGTTVNMTTVAGGDPTPFLGLATGAIINGTEFVTPFGLAAAAPRLLGTLRFDAPTIVVADGFAPFVFNGVVTAFARDDLDARTPLFQETLTGQGTARLSFEDFDSNGALSGSFVTLHICRGAGDGNAGAFNPVTARHRSDLRGAPRANKPAASRTLGMPRPAHSLRMLSKVNRARG
jgi:hypothetical protein